MNPVHRSPLTCLAVSAVSLLVTSRAEAAEPAEGSGAPEPAALPAALPARSAATLPFGPFLLSLPVQLRERVTAADDIVVDADGASWSAEPAWDVSARVGARLSSERNLPGFRLVAEWEHEVVSGVHEGGLTGDLVGRSWLAPMSAPPRDRLRKASGQIDITQYVHLVGGRMMSHWGLGLVANDGAHGWTPGSARFEDPRGGDATLRGALMVGPFLPASVAVAGGVDEAKADDTLRAGDTAQQWFAAVQAGVGQPNHAGLYVVGREQTAEVDGDTTRVTVWDVTAGHVHALDNGWTLSLDLEATLIDGTTTYGSSVPHPEHDVLQGGGLLRAGAGTERAGAVVDVLFASGDGAADDDMQSGFKADPNLGQGLVLFPLVLGAWSARQTYTAYDPDLSGLPNEDLDRLPTQGAVTNALTLFPRGWWRPVSHAGHQLEVYGGPMFAWAPAPVADPLRTRLAGGDPRNARNGTPGSYYGTELDLGLRYQRSSDRALLQLGTEGGILLPGSVFDDPQAKAMDAVWAGRCFVEVSL